MYPTHFPPSQKALLHNSPHPGGVERGHMVGGVKEECQLRVEEEREVGSEEDRGREGQGGGCVH